MLNVSNFTCRGMGMYRKRHWIERVRAPAPPLAGWLGERDAAIVAPLPAAWQCDLATEGLRWTGGVFDLFGIPRGDRVDRRGTLEFYSEESREMLERLRSAAIATCGSFTFEAQIRRTDGEWRWMRVCADVQKRDGRAVTLYGTKQDVTAEMAALGR